MIEDLYEKYHAELIRWCRRMTQNESAAEDLVQETFMKALLSLSDEHTNMRAWLYMVARNLFYNQQKKNEMISKQIRR